MSASAAAPAAPLQRRRRSPAQTTTWHQSGRGDVAMLLPVEGVGLVEGDLVAAPRQRLEQPAIVGGGAVPVAGDQAGAVESDLHAHALLRSVGGTDAAAPTSRRGWRAARRRDGRRCGGRGWSASPVATAPARSPASLRTGQQLAVISVAVRANRKSVPAGTEPRCRATARRPAGCRRPAPRTRGWSGCPAGLRHRAAAAHARSPGWRRRPPALVRWQPAPIAMPAAASLRSASAG